MVNSISFIAATGVAVGLTAGFMTDPMPKIPGNTDPYALPTITLEEAKADTSLLTGVMTVSYHLTDDCSDLAVVSKTVAGKSDTISIRSPPSDDPLENLLCYVEQDGEGCTERNIFSSYMTEQGFQILQTDGDPDRQFPFWPWGECRPTQVLGYAKVHRGGEVITENKNLVSAHAYYELPRATLEEAKADVTLLSGLTTTSIYANTACTGPVIATWPHAGSGAQIYTREPMSEDAKLNIYCNIDSTAEGCVEASGYSYRYISENSTQIIVSDSSRLYNSAPYGKCIQAKAVGGASFMIHAGGHPIYE